MTQQITKIFSLAVGLVAALVLLTLGVTEEAPVGRLTGRLVMNENGQPIPKAVVTISTPVEELESDSDASESREYGCHKARGVQTRADGTFQISTLATGEYRVEVSARDHHLKPQKIEIVEGKTADLKLDAEPNDPSLDLYASQHVFTPNEIPKVELHGFVPGPEVNVAVYRLNLEKVAKNGGLEASLSPFASSNGVATHRLEQLGTKQEDLSHTIQKRDAEGGFVEALPVGKLPEGYYYVTCRADKVHAQVALCVSDLALVTKTDRSHTICFTTNLRSGTPVAGVRLQTDNGGELKTIGTTGPNGLAELTLPSKQGPRVIVGQKRSSVALVGLRELGESGSDVKVFGYCERPAYRPGDLIQFKGIVRRVANDGYQLIGGGTASIKVSDPDGNEIASIASPISAHGTFNGSFATSPESKPGIYTIDCSALGGKSIDMGANVVAYRKPEYSVEVLPVKQKYVMGGKASATIECKYYYGGPVVGASLKAVISRSPRYQFESDDADDSDADGPGDYGMGGEYSTEVTAITDASGRANISFDTLGDNDPDVFTNDYTYDIVVSASEDGGKRFEGEGKVEVYRGDYDLYAEVQNPVVSPGETVDLLLKTTDVIDHHKSVGHRKVQVECGRLAWTSNSSVFVPRTSYDVVTGSDGTVHVRIPVTSADLLSFRAHSVDNSGRTVVAESSVYVEGSPSIVERGKGTIKLTLDHHNYNPGDQGRALIQTDLPGGTALVCVQAAGILWKQTVPVTSNATILKFPVVAQEAPNAYVSVSYVREKRFLRSDQMLRVKRADRDLHVTVTPEKDAYLPGQTAQINLTTTDSTGHPLAAEVSIGVVDQGIYDITPDNTDLKADLYPQRSSDVDTQYSFPEIYLDGGDKGTSKIPLRKRFRDTAFWKPTVWTGTTGKVNVSVPLPDNVTGWKVTAIGITDSSMVGMSKATFHARKPLMTRLQLPQFMVAGDSQRMSVVVSNDTGQDQDVKVDLQGQGVTLDNNGPKTVRVAVGKPQVLEYQMVAGKGSIATLTARAWVDGGPNDGVQQTFPIKPHGRKILATSAGQGSAEFSLPILATADPKEGNLEIQVSPSLTGSLVGSLDQLIGFPYGCVEQTMSRFLPSVLVAQTVRDLGLPKPKRLNELPSIVRDSLARLSNMQHDDGGWGWWEYDDSNPEMTALALDGLARAKAAGWNVSPAKPEKAVAWAVKSLEADAHAKYQMSIRDRIYLIDAVLRWGETGSKALLDGFTASKLNSVELATLALAYNTAGNADQARSTLDLLKAKAQDGKEVAYWAPETNVWGDEATSWALAAFEAIRPADPIVPKLVRYLMNTRKGLDWQSTRDSAYALIGLTQYLKQNKEQSQPSTAEILVDGKSVKKIYLDPKLPMDPNWTLKIPRSSLGNSSVSVHLVNTGPGKCYYSVQLNTLDIAPELKPETTDPGLSVVRHYYRLEPRQLENGSIRLLPTLKPMSSFTSGDLVRVEIDISSDVPRKYMMIEEPTPSSCRVEERDVPGGSDQWSEWWSRTVTLDDRVAFFATEIPKGTSKITYTMTAEQTGKVSALPTMVQNMYDPERNAYAAEDAIQVEK